MTDRTDGFPRAVGVVQKALNPALPFKPLRRVWADSRLADTTLPEGVTVCSKGAA